jgi:hypothetical protein
MKEPAKWFEDALNSGKYDEDIIVEIKSCVTEEGFDVKKFLNWVSEQLETGIGEN